MKTEKDLIPVEDELIAWFMAKGLSPSEGIWVMLNVIAACFPEDVSDRLNAVVYEQYLRDHPKGTMQ